MFIKNLKITNFRSLIHSEYEFRKSINIFYGLNGTGKTSIIEAIYYLSSGKSFRKGTFKSLIKYNTDDLTVFINYLKRDQLNSLSVNKNKNGKWNAKHNNTKILKQSKISAILPVVIIDPEVYQIIDLGPAIRRSYLDWLVFHVKHDYLILWKKVYKCIKHLNNLYKSKQSNEELDLWEKTFSSLSEELNNIRELYFKEITPYILSTSQFMQKDIGKISLNYKKGWSQELTLHQQLKKDRDKNLLYGQLQHGPQKMDIKISINSMIASHVLSRGQKKILAICFYLANINLLQDHSISPIICLDDIDAELDSFRLLKVAEFFKKSDLQVFITTVHKNKVTEAFDEFDMFHVKH